MSLKSVAVLTRQQLTLRSAEQCLIVTPAVLRSGAKSAKERAIVNTAQNTKESAVSALQTYTAQENSTGPEKRKEISAVSSVGENARVMKNHT